MSNRFIPLSTAVIVMLVSGIGHSQAASPLPGFHAAGVSRDSAIEPPDVQQRGRVGWFHRLMFGTPEDPLLKTNASQPIAPPRTGSPHGPAAVGVTSNPRGPVAVDAFAPNSTRIPPQGGAKRTSWLRHLVVGKSDDELLKTNASQAHVHTGSDDELDGHMGGVASSGSPYSPKWTQPLADSSASPHARRGAVEQRENAFMLDDPYSRVQESDGPSWNRRRDSSVALATWLPRLPGFSGGKRPKVNHALKSQPSSQGRAGGMAADPSMSQSESQSLAMIGPEVAPAVATPVRLPEVVVPESQRPFEQSAEAYANGMPAAPTAPDSDRAVSQPDDEAAAGGGSLSLIAPPSESDPAPLTLASEPTSSIAATPLDQPHYEYESDAGVPTPEIASDSSLATVDVQPIGPIYQSETMAPVNGPFTMPSSPVQVAEGASGRPKIIYRPVVVGVDGQRNAVLRPDVQLADDVPTSGAYPDRFAQLPPTEDLPPPAEYVPETEVPVDEGWMPPISSENGYYTNDFSTPHVGAMHEFWYKLRANLKGPRSVPPGIGVENVMNAPFWIDTTQPLNNCRLRADAAADLEFPDRAEFFWARTPNGKGPGPDIPLGEPEVDYQDLSFYIERGTKRFSVGTELPIRSVDPDIRLNSTGFADMNLTTKALLLDGRLWQLTQIFRTYFPTGSDNRGTGNGHFSMEPGFAWRYKWSDVTYVHGDMKYWFPIAADPDFSGQILNYGIGMSHVLYDSDRWSVMPTFEMKGWTVLDGQQTLPFSQQTVEIDTLSILNFYPGLRIICDKGCDCGVKEFGISGGVTVTEDHWYEEILRLEFRWVH